MVNGYKEMKMSRKDNKQTYILFLLAIFLAGCTDKEALQNIEKGMTKVTMVAPNLQSGDNTALSTRSVLSPSTGGTTFRWGIGDVASVYSSGRGMTNFFIDESSISEDGTSARFNGSGFTLSPESKYYAFYPYNAGALDKTNIPIHYSGQNIAHNGSFKDLGNYDYMFAVGNTNESGNVNFDFNHIGCVVEFLLQAPETAVYKQVRFELEGAINNNAFVKSGTVNVTDENSVFTADNSLSTDTIMRVNLNGGQGLSIKKDSLLRVYMMVAPQNLSDQKIVIRLLDTNSTWYSAKVSGKNMKSGYTYHYNITDNSEFGGFTGKGHGLPDDYTYKFISSYKDSNVKNYEDLVVDGNIVYAVGGFGIRKINFEDEKNPFVEKSTDLGLSSMRFRSIAEKGDYLYVSLRQGSAGALETILPKLKLNFETHAASYSSELSNNKVINSFFRYLALQSGTVTDVTLAYLYKAYKKNANEYRNSILLKFKNGSSVMFVGNSYNSREAALADLKSTYRTNNGDECTVDWTTLPEGGNVVKDIQMNNMGQFHSYTSVGSAKIDELGSPCPNTGLYSARLMTGEDVQSENKAMLTRNLDETQREGEISFWIKTSCIVNGKIEIPLLSEDGEERVKLSLQNVASNLYSLGLIIGEVPNTSDLSLKNNEWYNIKICIHSDGISLKYRTKESRNWISAGSYNTNDSFSFDAINVGIESNRPNALVYMDDLYFDTNDIDKSSYINGKLVVLNKSDLSVVNTYHLDLKGTELHVRDNKLVMSLLRGFNVYDISDPKSPKLTFAHRYPGYKECQGIDTYEANGHIYAFICNYSLGFTVVDITDVENPVIKTINEDDVIYNGVSQKGKAYNFDVVVDYPYAYLTHCTTKNYIGSDEDWRGVLTIDLSSLDNIKSSLTAVPKNLLYNKMSGDHCPISIAKYGNTLFIDNGEKGILSFDISNKEKPSFQEIVSTGENSQIGAIRTTQDGRIFISENGSSCCLKLYRAE